jgi:hypothetical protein
VFDPAAWDEPDDQEEQMLAGCAGLFGPEWVAGRHRWHAERRWHEAKYAYLQKHPALAEQEFEDVAKATARAWEP